MPLIDGFGRPITYLRVSVTDRCDFRCVYCMAETMQFLPRKDMLSFEEITTIVKAFSELGVSKVRITGGEPLIRRDVDKLFNQLGQLSHINELTLTTNGSHLAQYVPTLVQAGVKRVNVSLDSVDTNRFQQLSRTGHLEEVLTGIQVATRAGLKVKLNSVILKDYNSDEVLELVTFALTHQLDISFIEEMPLGNINNHPRKKTFISSAELRDIIHTQFPLTPSTKTTGGPARYWSTPNHTSAIGFISPHSHNFCSNCNRVRVTAEGKLLLCLGNENSVDLRHIVRQHPNNTAKLKQCISNAITHKPEQHHFTLEQEPDIVRFMNMTGG